ncbi:hypothetical protein CTheo_2673 [Ceratobasidium theobromae]|uniref:DUF590-domain-containing protein n=1 Tax=Ceratobasidium theobromae TaxID=1582974 RepID=A0A5N5QRT6_9AGAM|nr:hypothetical protein CTheo_2673 [Ceratobasidium theobromae]
MADLVIEFRIPKSRAEATEAAAEYKRLLSVLSNGGLKAAGKKAGDGLLVLVWCPEPTLRRLAEHERKRDFVYGVTYDAPPTISPAERIRLVHAYLTSPTLDNGLGIAPNTWPHIQSILVLHDRDFNHAWVSDWTRKQLGFSIPIEALDKVRGHFGESVALYFAFLSFYTRSLVIPSILGLITWVLKTPYHPLYSLALSVWAVATVEIWRVRERALSVRWGTHGVARVELRRVEFSSPTNQNDFHTDEAADADILFPWWKRELRMAISVPVIGLFGALLGALLSAIFLFEAFVTQLYDGPGKDYLGFVPTIIFVTVIPRIMAIYGQSATNLTNWENHAHESTFNRSLTLKTFALSSIVAFLGLFLTAFVYIPFGSDIMRWTNTTLFESGHPDVAEAATEAGIKPLSPQIHGKINPGRLHTQMFAYTVTNQAINFFLETGLPFILRGVSKARAKSAAKTDEKAHASPMVEQARKESSLPEYTLFGDYSEMVTQFGYVVVWSAAWPLAPLMALLNNWLELRSDAFKITAHNRRPLPQRVDTIGPWLEALGFITWVGALTNAALVYLFRPVPISTDPSGNTTTTAQSGSPFLTTTLARDMKLPNINLTTDYVGVSHATRTLLTAVLPAVLTALAASHIFFVVRALVKHLVERAVWRGSEEHRALGRAERQIKRKYLTGSGGADGLIPAVETASLVEQVWDEQDEGESVLNAFVKGE